MPYGHAQGSSKGKAVMIMTMMTIEKDEINVPIALSVFRDGDQGPSKVTKTELKNDDDDDDDDDDGDDDDDDDDDDLYIEHSKFPAQKLVVNTGTLRSKTSLKSSQVVLIN